MISISHSPNSNFKQGLIALSYLLLPWKWPQWRSGDQIKALEAQFSEYIGIQSASFSQAREALYAILKAFNIGEGDEVIIQGYTCIVVPNAVLFTGASPIYVDVDESLNIDPNLIEKSITPSTKAIIVQNAFGVPADVLTIKKICEKHSLKLIEDCALSLGAKVGGKKVGTFGDAAIFSFGRDKIISSVSGGMATASSKDVFNKVLEQRNHATRRPKLWVFQNLMHPLLISWMSRLIDFFKLGQILIKTSQALKLVNKVYTKKEKQSKKPVHLTYKMPNALAALASEQLKLVDAYNNHRQEIAEDYVKFCDSKQIKYQKINNIDECSILRFNILVEHASDVRSFARKKGFLLGDWYNQIVIPKPKDLEQIKYTPGSCPNSEEYARQSVNLPTHYKLRQKHLNRLFSVLEQIL